MSLSARNTIENHTKDIRDLKCLYKKLTLSLQNTNNIISIDSLNIDSNGILSLTFTDVNGNHTISTNSLEKFIIKYNVQNYNELLTTSPNLYEYAYVREEQGVKWLPGILGGTYYPAGLYMWDGVKWIKDDMTLINEINNIINTMDTWEQVQW